MRCGRQSEIASLRSDNDRMQRVIGEHRHRTTSPSPASCCVTPLSSSTLASCSVSVKPTSVSSVSDMVDQLSISSSTSSSSHRRISLGDPARFGNVYRCCDLDDLSRLVSAGRHVGASLLASYGRCRVQMISVILHSFKLYNNNNNSDDNNNI